jgi:hypothetical protein
MLIRLYVYPRINSTIRSGTVDFTDEKQSMFEFLLPYIPRLRAYLLFRLDIEDSAMLPQPKKNADTFCARLPSNLGPMKKYNIFFHESTNTA